MNMMVVMPLGEFGGGAEQMLATYLEASADSQDIAHHFLFLSDGHLVDRAREFGYRVEVVSAGRLRNFPKWVCVQRRIARLIDFWNIDRVLAWMPKGAMYAALPARTKGVALYMWRHDIPLRIEGIERLVLSLGRLRGVACSSNTAQRAFQTSYPNVPSRTIYPAAQRLPVVASVASQLRRTLLAGTDGPIVGTIARLQPWKRIDLLLKSAAELKKLFPNLRIVVVGGESHGLSMGYGAELKTLGRSLLGDSVYFAGEQRNIGDWLEAMDVFVLPSEGEPFGIALVEALGAGKPVVACSGGGPDEIITRTTVGRVVSRNPTPTEMSHAIAEMLSTDNLNQARLVNSYEAMRFSPHVMARYIDAWLSDA